MTIRLWPRSLFGRLALLLLLVILVSQATAIYLFRQDRAALLARQFSDTKIVQLKALRAGLAAAAPTATSATLAQFGEVYQARIVPADERRFVGGQPQNRVLLELQERLKAELGPQTEVRIQPRLQLLWIKLQAGEHAYWAGFQLTPRPGDDAQSRAVEWSLIALVVLLASAFAFARYLARPLRQLSDAVSNVGRGQSPAPLPETGPSEIVSLNRGFNQMLASLHQAEQDRALLLAGVSHDLRTPLSRLRLAVEVGTRDERERAAMVGDIEEIDKIIGQFLDFARDQRDAPLEPRGLNDIVADVVERYRRGGGDVRFAAGEIPMVALRPTAMSRLIVNLIDNALRYGAPPVDVTTRRAPDAVVLEISDRGQGIPVDQVERLKRPFTRGEPARSGAAGAGLGLAIVDRIARMHGGSFDLLPREGGGALARVIIPLGNEPGR
ncbi:MAG: HAMP domain-containing protein [Betaproteobacteria bacterium]|nr:MAG: HAMP domain-containing protein [Betaproteobacteria bacterium]